MYPEYMKTMSDFHSPILEPLVGEQAPDRPSSPLRTGKIRHVDAERWTVDVDFEGTNQGQFSIPMSSPYFNDAKGQGAYFIPEIGARCILAYACDTWFILSYLPPLDVMYVESASTKKETQKLTEAGRSGKPYDSTTAPRTTAFRNKRESDMQPGDYCIKTRAFNKSKWFTNGNILHQANDLCKRIYSALKDEIIDICNNFLFKTPGGSISWTNEVVSSESDYKREIKQETIDKYPSFTEVIGHDASTYQVIVSDKNEREVVEDNFADLTAEEAFFPEKYRLAVDDGGAVINTIGHNHKDGSGFVVYGYSSLTDSWGFMKGYTSEDVTSGLLGDESSQYTMYVDDKGTCGRVINSIGITDSSFEELISPNGDLSEKSKGKKVSDFIGDVWLKSGGVNWISGDTEVHLNPPTPDIDTVTDELISEDATLEAMDATNIDVASSISSSVTGAISGMASSAVSALAGNVPSVGSIMSAATSSVNQMASFGGMSSATQGLLNSGISNMTAPGQLSLANASVKSAVMGKIQSMDPSTMVADAISAGIPGVPAVGATMSDIKGKMNDIVDNAISNVDVSALMPAIPPLPTPTMLGDLKKLTNPLDSLNGMGAGILENLTGGLKGRITGKVKGLIP